MNTELKQLSELLVIMDAREEIINKLTNKILYKLEPNVLAVLNKLLGIPVDDISWIDVQVIDNVLLLTCTVVYDPFLVTPFIEKLFIADPEDFLENTVHKMIRIGVPTPYIFGPTQVLFDFFNDLADNANLGNNKVIVDNIQESSDNTPSAFHISDLSQEQRQQLLLFGKCTNGERH